jgi:signal recognition particle subunit SRP54
MRKAQFTFEDFLDQLQQVRKMGSLQSLLGMIPGLPTAKLKGLQIDDKAFDRSRGALASPEKAPAQQPYNQQGNNRDSNRNCFPHCFLCTLNP